MPNKKYATLKVIQDYFFSKVELIETGNKKYILKSVPDFFGGQVKRQAYLIKRCKKTRIPKIHRIWTEKKRRYFMMDFVESDGRQIPKEEFIKTISVFHQETAGAKSRLFPVYDFSVFREEFLKSRRLMPKELYGLTKSVLDDFKGIFSLPQSVVHGDWVPAQLIGRNAKYFLIDFEMSFYGPSILDHAHFFMKEGMIGRDVLDQLRTDDRIFLKARIVETLRKFGWVVNSMSSGHTKYKFETEIKEYVGILERLMKERGGCQITRPD